MHTNLQSHGRRRGSAMLLYTLLLPVVVLMAGLAIDVTMVYIAQAQLQTAVDGAAHGALRLLGTAANTTEIAGEFLRANMPTGYWWSKNLVPKTIAVTTSSNSNTITVTATVDVPLMFLQLLGKTTSTVAATSSASAWGLTPCNNFNYPSGSAPALSSVAFNESQVMVAFGPTYVVPHGAIMTWYSDEHALTLGVREVNVIGSGGATVTTDFPFTLFTGVLAAVSPSGPLPVGTTDLTGDTAGTDIATWNNTYGYLDQSRPIWPAIFVTDITLNPTDTSGDWQQGGTTAFPPSAVYGTWKGAVRTVDYSGGGKKTKGGSQNATPATITLTEDADPSQNQWNGVPDTPPGGFPKCDGYCSEIVWNLDSLGLKLGRTYRLQFMIHDGDQHSSGGDSAQACVVATYWK